MTCGNPKPDGVAGETAPREVPNDSLDPGRRELSDATRALEAAYTSREVSSSMMAVGAVVVAGLVGVAAAVLLFGGAA